MSPMEILSKGLLSSEAFVVEPWRDLNDIFIFHSYAIEITDILSLSLIPSEMKKKYTEKR